MNLSDIVTNATLGLLGADSPQDAECRDVHSYNASLQCSFVNATSDCYVDEGYIQYILFIYCSLDHKLIPLAITILILWLLFLFIALAVAADNFFCPSLEVIAKVLHMSHNIAGVTLLAFGNGAPDVFSAISAVANMKDGDVGMVFGALLGAGVFLTTAVAGAVTLVGDFHAMERPFLRDIIFYIITVFFTFYICYDQVITVYEALGYIGAYGVYVVIVVAGRFIFQYMKRTSHLPRPIVTEVQANGNVVVEANADEEAGPRSISTTSSDSDLSSCNGHRVSETTPLLQNNYIGRVGASTDATSVADSENEQDVAVTSGSTSTLTQFLHAISPIDVAEWNSEEDKYYFGRMYAVVKAPALFALKMTVPLVDYSSPKHNWNKPLNVLHCIITPVFCVFAASSSFALQTIGSVFPVWVIFLIAGFLLAVVVFFTSRLEIQPVYHPAYAFFGFFSAVMWIKNIANEIVNILQAAGVVFSLSNTVLGLTFLAWGNSIGDLISDVSVARRGMPRAGLSACFGGPLFNTLLGIGIPFSIAAFKRGSGIPIEFSAIQHFLFIGLGVSLLSSLIIVPLLKFRMKRFYGGYLIALYAVFLVLALLIEVDVIHWAV